MIDGKIGQKGGDAKLIRPDIKWEEVIIKKAIFLMMSKLKIQLNILSMHIIRREL